MNEDHLRSESVSSGVATLFDSALSALFRNPAPRYMNPLFTKLPAVRQRYLDGVGDSHLNSTQVTDSVPHFGSAPSGYSRLFVDVLDESGLPPFTDSTGQSSLTPPIHTTLASLTAWTTHLDPTGEGSAAALA